MLEGIVTILIANGLKVIEAILSLIIATIVIPWIKTEMIPFLKEKRLYKIVSIGVNAAEKLAETTDMSGYDKKKYVLNYLRSKGIIITEEIEAFIEAACYDLDLVTGTVKEQFDTHNGIETLEDITPVG
jgi:hypothetical protein